MQPDVNHIRTGGTRKRELKKLYELAKSLPPDAVIVEIGSAHGRATITMAQGLVDGNGGTVYAIDPCVHPWKGTATTDSNRNHLADNIAASGLTNIRHIDDYSYNVARWFTYRIDMLFIDGDHSYEGASQDFDLFVPMVRTGGVVAMHDVGEVKDIRRAVRERVYGHPKFSNLRNKHTLLIFTKGPGKRRE